MRYGSPPITHGFVQISWYRAQGQGRISRSTADHLEPVRWLQVCSVHIGLNDDELVTDLHCNY